MIKSLLLVSGLALTIQHGHCQDAPKAFEVASVTPCKPGTPEPLWEHTNTPDFIAPGGRFTARSVDLKFLVEWAYGILPAQHSEGPSWFGSDRYDIVAKAEGNPSEAQIKLMLQALLVERFKLQCHRETRELSVLAVSLGKNPPKLSPAKDGETRALRIEPRMGPDQKVTSFHVMCTRFTLAQLSATFARQLGRVLVDRTGLEGEFDFSFDMTPDEHQPNPMDASILIAALRDQIGLSVKPEKAPVDFWIIDRAEKVAAGNQ